MFSIAKTFKISILSLKSANPGVSLDQLKAGQVLSIPIQTLDGTGVSPVRTTLSNPKSPTNVNESNASKIPTLVNKSASTDPSSLNADQKEALDIHNKARARISKACNTPRPALKWNSTLAAEADAYAKRLMQSGSFLHSGTKGEGENLAKFMPATNGSMAKGVEMWLGEEKDYHGEPIDANYGMYGHWTQVIWPTTTEVGLGVARGSGVCVVVGRYKEPGNLRGSSAWYGKVKI
ncbi:PR-1-like protein [Mytilinidion resinicola]|uniref:PR-1-like protein n=1 Tax=Mytilinidion resinicola TaxID=574789 RepID=A0A6A6Y463_9PEZI|nr:PR-1-like protein [Mytilinidion resinicola]KAF2802814.1 PR-1-like protein [Mytilinidion resinicola]